MKVTAATKAVEKKKMKLFGLLLLWRKNEVEENVVCIHVKNKRRKVERFVSTLSTQNNN
jgi:hypothetical protein